MIVEGQIEAIGDNPDRKHVANRWSVGLRVLHRQRLSRISRLTQFFFDCLSFVVVVFELAEPIRDLMARTLSSRVSKGVPGLS